MGSLRCFVAVHIDDATRAAAHGLQERLRGVVRDVKWVAPENLHLTVKFLGDVDEAGRGRLARGLARAAAAVPPFAASLRGAGAFPGPSRPRVLWAGVGEGGRELLALWRATEDELAREGFPREGRDFEPHLTLGRARQPAPAPGLSDALAAVRDTTWGSFRVVAFCLMKSTLTPRGPIYDRLSAFPLAGA